MTPWDAKVTLSPDRPRTSLISGLFVLSVLIPSQYSQLDALPGWISPSLAEVKAFSLLNKRERGFFESFLFYFYLFALKLFFLTSKPIDFFSQCPTPKQTSRTTRTELQTHFHYCTPNNHKSFHFPVSRQPWCCCQEAPGSRNLPVHGKCFSLCSLLQTAPCQQQGRVCSPADSSLTLLTGCFCASVSCKTKTSLGQGKNPIPPGLWQSQNPMISWVKCF